MRVLQLCMTSVLICVHWWYFLQSSANSAGLNYPHDATCLFCQITGQRRFWPMPPEKILSLVQNYVQNVKLSAKYFVADSQFFIQAMPCF